MKALLLSALLVALASAQDAPKNVTLMPRVHAKGSCELCHTAPS